jgi:5'-nucleotidase
MWLFTALSVSSLIFSPGPRCISVVGTNDMHGVIEPLTRTVGHTTLRYGGVLGLSAYLQNIRTYAQNRVVLLDGGDIYQGTLPSNTSQGKAMVSAMNVLGYTASAVGNHEFDYGPLSSNPQDLLGIVKQRIQEAHFPFLAANIRDNTTQALPSWKNLLPSTLVNIQGLKIGIIGASTPETPRTTLPHQVASLTFLPPAQDIVAESQKLRAQGAQWVILTAHMGGQCPMEGAPNNADACNMQDEELISLLRSLPKGTLDIAVGGHTHALIAHWVNGVATIESGARTQYLGWIESCLGEDDKPDPSLTVIHTPVELCLDHWKDTHTCEKRATESPTERATFLNQPLVVSKKLQRTLKPYLARAKKEANKTIGVHLPHSLELDAPSTYNLGEWVAQAMQKSLHTDVAIQNKGGVRTHLPSGNITYGDIYQALPFDNRLVHLQVTGSELLTFIQNLTHNFTKPFPYMAGIICQKNSLFSCYIKKTVIKNSEFYTLATNDFLVSGGDGASVFSKIEKNRINFSNIVIRDSFVSFLKFKYDQK